MPGSEQILLDILEHDWKEAQDDRQDLCQKLNSLQSELQWAVIVCSVWPFRTCCFLAVVCALAVDVCLSSCQGHGGLKKQTQDAGKRGWSTW